MKSGGWERKRHQLMDKSNAALPRPSPRSLSRPLQYLVSINVCFHHSVLELVELGLERLRFPLHPLLKGQVYLFHSCSVSSGALGVAAVSGRLRCYILSLPAMTGRAGGKSLGCGKACSQRWLTAVVLAPRHRFVASPRCPHRFSSTIVA